MKHEHPNGLGDTPPAERSRRDDEIWLRCGCGSAGWLAAGVLVEGSASLNALVCPRCGHRMELTGDVDDAAPVQMMEG